MFKREYNLIAILILFSAFLSGCSQDNPDVDNIYQQYQVIVTPSYKSAFANLRSNDATGERLYLKGEDVLTVNAKTMYYQDVVANGATEFNYSAAIDNAHKKAIFKLRKDSKHTLTNEIDFDVIPDIEFPQSMSEITNGESLSFDMPGINASELRVMLVSTLVSTEENTYQARVNLSNASFVFLGVPSGRYDMYVDLIHDTPTTQNFGDASGNIRLIKRQILHSVRVN